MSVSKYHNRRVVVEGIRFDSQAEATRYQQLKLMERAGEISGLAVHPRFQILAAMKGQRAIDYEGDFAYFEPEWPACIVEDVKGVETAVFRLKAKMFRARYGDSYDLRVIRAEAVLGRREVTP